jgi:hypothetical protein
MVDFEAGAPDSSPGNERNQWVPSQMAGFDATVRHSVFPEIPNRPSRNVKLDAARSLPQATPAVSCVTVRSTPTPRGCLKSITATLHRTAREGDVEGFRAYVRGNNFLTAFSGLAPERRASVMRAFVNAEVVCEAKARQPLRAPKPIDAKRTEKVTWADPIMRAKLAGAYVRTRGDDEAAARILGVTVGSARLARRRYLGGPANSRGRSQEAQGRPFTPTALPSNPTQR